jgi:protease I
MAELNIRNVRGKRVAVIVADGFEQRELDAPVAALREAGVIVEVLAQDRAHLKHIRGVNHLADAAGTKADRLVSEAKVDDYDALMIPGGAVSPDLMRQSPTHLQLTRDFVESGKPVAAICHGPWLLADAGCALGRTVTSWPGIRRDLERAGATWVDREVVVDGNLITSRKPKDVAAFASALLDLLARGRERPLVPPLSVSGPLDASDANDANARITATGL